MERCPICLRLECDSDGCAPVDEALYAAAVAAGLTPQTGAPGGNGLDIDRVIDFLRTLALDPAGPQLSDTARGDLIAASDTLAWLTRQADFVVPAVTS